MRVTPLLFIFAVGCGRMGFDGIGGGDDSDVTGPQDNPIPPSTMRIVPEVCGMQAWSLAVADPDLALSSTPTGAAVFYTPRAGGDISGFLLDNALNRAAPPQVVRAGNFASVGANYVDGSIVVAGVSGNRAVVHLVDNALAATEIANVDAMFVSESSVAHVNGARFTPTSCSAGLTVNPFDGSWNSQPSEFTATSDQSTGLATTPFGAQALSVWSTSSQCHVVRHTSKNSGVETIADSSCSAPRIATNDTEARIAYESNGMVVVADFAADAFGAMPAMLANGSSPRVVFDGTRYWMSYLDAEGDLNVGFIDDTGAFASLELAGTTPAHDGYEIAMIDGKLWQVSLTGTDAIAHQICLVTH